MDKIVFLFVESLRNLWRHKSTALISVLTVSISLFFLGLILIVNENSEKLPELFRSKYKIEVFFKEDISKEEAKQIIRHLKREPIVGSTSMIDKIEAEQIFIDEFGENIVDILGYNPLPISCLINLDKQKFSINKTEKLVQKIENIKGVLSVEYEGKMLSKLERTYSFVLGFLKIMVGVVLIISIIIITNTVKLTINSRSELIRTLKLIGATNLFVKTPFMFEGIFQAILGAFVAYGLLYWGVIELNHLLVDWISFQWTIGNMVLFLIMTVSVLIGFVGSINAVSKFLK